MPRKLSNEEVDALIAQDEWWRSPEGQAQAAREDAEWETAMQRIVAEGDVLEQQLEERMKQVKKKEDKMLAEINSVVDKLKEAPLKIGAKTGTSGKIFGSVTSLQITRAIREQRGYEIDRKRISIVDEVKELGTYKANIEFGNGQSTEIEFEVVAE